MVGVGERLKASGVQSGRFVLPHRLSIGGEDDLGGQLHRLRRGLGDRAFDYPFGAQVQVARGSYQVVTANHVRRSLGLSFSEPLTDGGLRDPASLRQARLSEGPN